MSYSVDYHTAIGRQVEGANTDKRDDNIIFEFVFKPWQIERARTGGNDLKDAITNHHCYFITWFFLEIPGSKTSLLSLLCKILSTYIIFNLWKTSLFVDVCNKIIYFLVSFSHFLSTKQNDSYSEITGIQNPSEVTWYALS